MSLANIAERIMLSAMGLSGHVEKEPKFVMQVMHTGRCTRTGPIEAVFEEGPFPVIRTGSRGGKIMECVQCGGRGEIIQ